MSLALWYCFDNAKLNSKMHFVVGATIKMLYRNNLDNEPLTDLPSLVQDIVELDSRLGKWKVGLPSDLRYDHDVISTQGHSLSTGRLKVLLHLRYLNLRILIHRPVLRMSLRRLSGASSSSTSTHDLDEMFEKPSLTILPTVAIELIDLVNRASGPVHLLGAWWFALYYSELTICSNSPFH